MAIPEETHPQEVLMLMPLPESFETLCATLESAIAHAAESPLDLERQRAVCLAGRSVDADFYEDTLFSGTVDLARLRIVQDLLGQAKQVLPAGSTYWNSVVERLEELEAMATGMARGEFLEMTSVSAA